MIVKPSNAKDVMDALNHIKARKGLQRVFSEEFARGIASSHYVVSTVEGDRRLLGKYVDHALNSAGRVQNFAVTVKHVPVGDHELVYSVLKTLHRQNLLKHLNVRRS